MSHPRRRLAYETERRLMPVLADRLAAHRAQQARELRAAYDLMVGELAERGFDVDILGVGQQFPDAILPSAEGELVALADLRARGPLVVTFFRGEWCPYCRLTLDALAASQPALEAAGASLVAITPETGGLALEARRKHRARFAILSDVDCGLGLACGVVFRTPEAYRSLLLRFGTDLAKRHGNDAWFLPIPCTFVIDSTGVVRWRFASLDFTTRAEPEDVISALAALGKT
jgi:peroxiredoxin